MSLDTQLFFALNGLAGQSPVTDGIIVFLASYLAYILVAALLVLVWCAVYSRREKLELLAVTFGAALIARGVFTELIRHFYHRPRPFVTMDVHQLLTDSAWSFPSGHATFFFALAMAVYLYNKRWGSWFFGGAALITLARVASGIHYPSDILAGAIIGVFTGYFTYFFAHRWLQNQRIRPIDK